MDRESLKTQTLLQQEERKMAYQVIRHENKISIDKLTLELVENFKEAFNTEKLAIRYTPLLAQYDYLVGDISAEQLRLKGFYRNEKHVPNQDKIETLQDYLYEYVNFGAPYFVLENINPRQLEQEDRPKNNRRTHKNNHKRSPEKEKNKTSVRETPQKKEQQSNKKPSKRPFIIKQK
ncbi:YutD family protein [Leuconostoc gasicomitatum]|uniref:YutD family protein n=1 Tax=Leuconostoc gasicomitatum TaxID=115778 RepID=UPI001CC64B7E|nr:YutD family protein [Leuconostoc gasicomitatum]MBZ5951940.1 YutD family protein [Leuconostoc gasicomitatum]